MHLTRNRVVAFLITGLAVAAAPLARGRVVAQTPWSNAERVDKIAQDVLKQTGVPSASMSIVVDKKIVYSHAEMPGSIRRFPPRRPCATASARSASSSRPRRFSCSRKTASYRSTTPSASASPGLARGNDVTIRQILSHTSGYQDYWAQDYVMPGMLKSTTAQQILDVWARRSLDFEPGTKWQYSNTNYVIAGLIVEKVAGEPLWSFLGRRVFTPLGMKSVTNTDDQALPDTDPRGYLRYALGPLHPAPKEGKGWMFAAGEIAATADDVARWDISMIAQTILKPESYRQMETEVLLQNGFSSHYGLGVDVRAIGNHRAIEHTGEVSGFTAENIVFPDDGIAVVVLTNQDAARAGSAIGQQVATALLDQANTIDHSRDAIVRKVFDGFLKGEIDRTLFTDNANAYFSTEALHDYATSLSALGAVQSFTVGATSLRGGMTFRSYSVKFAARTVSISIYEMPDGKFEQFLVI